MTRFGTVRSPVDITNAVIERLKTWGPAYVDEINAHYGTTLKPLREVIRVQELSRYPENKLPVACVVVGTTIGEPIHDERGYYSAIYGVSVGAIVSARSEEDTRRAAELYGASIKLALGQRRKLADDVTVRDWTGEATDVLRVREQKRLLACINSFAVRLDNVFSWKEGPGPGEVPPDPNGPPLADWPEATDVALTIQKEPV